MTLQLLDDLAQPLALVKRCQRQRLERFGIIRKVVAHRQSAHIRASLTMRSMPLIRAAHNYPAFVGTIVSRAAWTHRQSSPSSSADNSAPTNASRHPDLQPAEDAVFGTPTTKNDEDRLMMCFGME
ncbi:hypothetical protein BjapCC829_07820 [Bradyrhizobium barranii]|uniref:Uncharacterized protein n=1 Tax=Bradyrhizobium barranii TaxID=2992140 RepID=A0ABY3QZR7_9BRAD|nr:hypothetical protein [Bradyrhizobium japonicum]UFW91504.1 hypothetical protein BjapCC829_07820 [Bradyrhizobium japonicum]